MNLEKIRKSFAEKLQAVWKNDKIWRILLYFTALVLLVVSVFAVLTWPSHDLEQIRNIRSQLQGQIDEIRTVQQPDTIEIGQSASTLSNQIQTLTLLVAEQVSPLSTPAGWTVAINDYRSSVKLPDDFEYENLVKEYVREIKELSGIYDYHLGALLALQPAFELNPAAEFGLVDSSTGNVARAEELVETIAGVKKQFASLQEEGSDPYEDDALQLLDAIIRQFKGYQEGEISNVELYELIDELQADLRGNRQLYWKQYSAEITQRLSEIDARFAQLELTLNSIN